MCMSVWFVNRGRIVLWSRIFSKSRFTKRQRSFRMNNSLVNHWMVWLKVSYFLTLDIYIMYLECVYSSFINSHTKPLSWYFIYCVFTSVHDDQSHRAKCVAPPPSQVFSSHVRFYRDESVRRCCCWYWARAGGYCTSLSAGWWRVGGFSPTLSTFHLSFFFHILLLSYWVTHGLWKIWLSDA